MGALRGAGQLHYPGQFPRPGADVGGSLPGPARGCLGAGSPGQGELSGGISGLVTAGLYVTGKIWAVDGGVSIKTG